MNRIWVSALTGAGLVTRLRGPTADVAAFRERGPLRPPTSSLRAIPASRTASGTAQPIFENSVRVPAVDPQPVPSSGLEQGPCRVSFGVSLMAIVRGLEIGRGRRSQETAMSALR